MSQFKFQTTIASLVELLPAVIFVVAVVSFVAGLPWLVNIAKKQELRAANEFAEKHLYDQRLQDEGCIPSGFVPHKNVLRAVFVCPDGSVDVGQVDYPKPVRPGARHENAVTMGVRQ